MIDVMVRADQRVQVLNPSPDLLKGFFERRDAVGGVHSRIDQRPRAVTIDQINIDDRRPHRQRQKNLVDSRMDLGNFR